MANVRLAFRGSERAVGNALLVMHQQGIPFIRYMRSKPGVFFSCRSSRQTVEAWCKDAASDTQCYRWCLFRDRDVELAKLMSEVEITSFVQS